MARNRLLVDQKSSFEETQFAANSFQFTYTNNNMMWLIKGLSISLGILSYYYLFYYVKHFEMLFSRKSTI